MCFKGRGTCLPLVFVDLSLWWQAPCKAFPGTPWTFLLPFFQVLADIPPQSFWCWLWDHRCRMNQKLDPHFFGIFSSVGTPFAMSSAKNNSSSIFVCTLDLTCNLLRLKSFPSKRYLIGIPLSPSWKASGDMAENITLKNVGTSTQPCLTLFVTGNESENSPSFWTHAK